MSAIIKSGSTADHSGVRALNAPSAQVVLLARQDEEQARLRRAIAALEGELRQRDIAMDVLRQDVERAFEDGRSKGHRDGLAEAQDRQDARLALLESAAQQAKASVARELVSLERLSALLARECVDKILGDPNDRAALVGQIVAAQIVTIEKAMLLGVEVSRQDFSDDVALAGLAERLGPAIAVTASPQIASGGCVMVLRLGRMTVGLDQQWSALRDLLGVMASPVP